MDNPSDNSTTLQADGIVVAARDPVALVMNVVLGLTVAVAVLALAGLVAGGLLVWDAAQVVPAEMVAPVAILGFGGWLVIALAAVGLLVGVLAMLHVGRQMAQQTHAVDQRLAAIAERAFARAEAADASTEPSTEHVELRRILTDMREILLLPEQQRQARYESMMRAELRRRLGVASQYIDSRAFHRAREELASLAERFGASADLQAMQQQLAAATQDALHEDIEIATRKITDLMTMTRWEQAEQYARELTQKYPDAVEARNLLQRVQEERDLFARRHRQRMHDEIQQHVNRRRWREAAGAAEIFIQTFPVGMDSDALRQQLDTLKANAEIEIRQQLERHIKEYITRKDYWSAMELGRRIIAEYPFSPQATALRTQLPRLEELARQQGQR